MANIYFDGGAEEIMTKLNELGFDTNLTGCILITRAVCIIAKQYLSDTSKVNWGDMYDAIAYEYGVAKTTVRENVQNVFNKATNNKQFMNSPLWDKWEFCINPKNGIVKLADGLTLIHDYIIKS